MKLRKWFSLLLAAVMVFSLCACAQEQENAPSVAAGDGPLDPYEQTLTLNILKSVEPAAKYIDGESLDDNVITRYIKEKLNIEIVNKWTVSSDQYATQLNLAIGSDDLPDMAETTLDNVVKMHEYEQIQPLTEAYEKYASDLLRSILEYNDKEAFKNVTIDGELYGIPLPNDVGDFIALAYVREDWRQELGLPEPKTLDDYVKMARAFVENDMAGKGKNNTIGIGMDSTLGYTLDALAAPFGAYQDRWIDYGDGNLKFSNIQPEMKEALQFVNQLYTEGLIDPNFASANFNRTIQLALQGRTGIVFGPFWYAALYLRSSISADSDIQWKCYPIAVNNETGELNVPCGRATYRYLVCREGFQNPEALVKLMNLWAEIWVGEQAEWFHGIQREGQPYAGVELKYYYPLFFDPPEKNSDNFASIREALADPANPDPSKLLPAVKGSYERILDPEVDTTYAELLVFSIFKIIREEYTGHYVYDQYQGSTTENMISYSGLCTDYLKAEFVKLITGERSFDDWAEIEQQWRTIGGTAIEQDVNAWYDAQN